MRLGFVLLLIGCLTSCSTGTHYAPVTDISTIERIPKSGVYRVLPGETLYSIAWRYGLDYRYLAKRNNIAPPYHVDAGQWIYLNGKATQTTRMHVLSSSTEKRQTVMTKHSVSRPVMYHEVNTPVTSWLWPAKGPVISTYSRLNKGINIAGRLGTPIFATAQGQVVYSGNGLRGYGNLIIIKHNARYLTAYAHNSAVFVKEGDWVNAGKKIASMGNTGARQVMLHFEIRVSGQHVNPLRYLARSRH